MPVEVWDDTELTRLTVESTVAELGGLSPVSVTVKAPTAIPPVPAVTVTCWLEIPQVPTVEEHSEVAVY